MKKIVFFVMGLVALSTSMISCNNHKSEATVDVVEVDSTAVVDSLCDVDTVLVDTLEVVTE